MAFARVKHDSNKLTKQIQISLDILVLNVKNEAGAIAKISSIFVDDDISIEALIQHEARNLEEPQDTVPVVIISGSVSEEIASKLMANLESMKEIDAEVRQFRIHNAMLEALEGQSPEVSFFQKYCLEV